MKQPIPTNLVFGFLGVGKTTAIIDLLKHKPAGEVWAVLVNEFGEVGIDGALLEQEGAVVREVPGGCMCCVAGLPMKIGLNRLIHKAQPDRLLIEPTGLGHPSQIIETLTSEHYQEVLALGPVLCLVDPRRLEEPRVLENVQFRDQVAAADILVANKTDLCTDAQLAHFDGWSEALSPRKRAVFHTRKGRLNTAWLDGNTDRNEVTTPHAHHLHADQEEKPAPPSLEDVPWQMVTNRGQGHASVGWRVHADTQLNESRLLVLALDGRFLRFKAVVHTNEGWRAINIAEGALSVVSAEPAASSRLEVISREALPAEELNEQLKQLIVSSKGRPHSR
ncbi:CobW family GTP-binding protein [Marinobacter changyiensis]|uniref:CobW family GTP-binding protein n=1 Tax=Marinobacter changyiensis TaxID=2604091 RepID=UPI001264C819|nr:GTP-binding protein [Marinobacter changyiensis]